MKSKIVIGVYGLAMMVMLLFFVPYNIYEHTGSGSIIVAQRRLSLFDTNKDYSYSKSVDYKLLGFQGLFITIPAGLLLAWFKIEENKKRHNQKHNY